MIHRSALQVLGALCSWKGQDFAAPLHNSFAPTQEKSAGTSFSPPDLDQYCPPVPLTLLPRTLNIKFMPKQFSSGVHKEIGLALAG